MDISSNAVRRRARRASSSPTFSRPRARRLLRIHVRRRLYHTLTVLDRSIKPWVAYVDGARNLWFEEYPQFPADHVLNGFDFAIFGVYDYYRATRDLAVRRHLQGVLTTVRERVAAYRVPGGVSYYCLGHKVQMLGYHELHVRQLRMLAAIANEPYFSSFADLLASDTGYEGTATARVRAFVAPLDVPAADR